MIAHNILTRQNKHTTDTHSNHKIFIHQDLRRVLLRPRDIFVGFALQYTIMPLSAFIVSRLAGLPLDHTIGLCLVGACPGGTASNVVTFLAGADVTLSVAMTTASTLGAVLMTPALTQLLLGTLVPVNARALLLSTLNVVLAPVALGAVLNTLFPRAIAALAPLSALSAVVLIALICGSIVGANAGAVLAAGFRLVVAVMALHSGESDRCTVFAHSTDGAVVFFIVVDHFSPHCRFTQSDLRLAMVPVDCWASQNVPHGPIA